MSSPTSEMPQDFTLRRHWQTARDMTPSTPPSPTSTTTEATPNGGMFSWLKSLFS